jgi:NitT/TauT family transport system substrate-binding protein
LIPAIVRRRKFVLVTRSARRLAAFAATAVLALAACSGSGASPSPAASAGSSAPASGAATKLIVGLGYIPSVQFAQFYLAQQEGYYGAAGLDVEFQNKIDPDLVTLVGQGAVDIGLADGTSVIPAGSQGIPIRYVATIYAQDPNIVLTTASSGIKAAAHLKGRKLGIPGKYGSSWIMLQSLLKGAGLTPSDVDIHLYSDFGQATALQQGAVDAATGFANNEPVQLQKAGVSTIVLRPSPEAAMPGPGLIASRATIDAKGAALKAFVAATLRAMTEIEANPDKGVDASIKVVPAIAQDRATAVAVMQATVTMWSSDFSKANGAGAVDTAAWTRAIAFMTSLGLVPTPVTADQLTTGALLK